MITSIGQNPAENYEYYRIFYWSSFNYDEIRLKQTTKFLELNESHGSSSVENLRTCSVQ